MNLVTIFFTSWVVALAGAITPGPMMTITISESVRKGAKMGPLIIVGHVLLELLLVIGLVLGLHRFVGHRVVIIAVSLLGGLYLLWMGWGMISDVRNGRVSLDLSPDDQRLVRGPVLTGFFVSLANPYFTIWWGTLGLKYITSAWAYGLAGLVVFFFGHILADFAWYGALSWAVARGKGLMNIRIYRAVIALCGAFVIILALIFIREGILML